MRDSQSSPSRAFAPNALTSPPSHFVHAPSLSPIYFSHPTSHITHKIPPKNSILSTHPPQTSLLSNHPKPPLTMGNHKSCPRPDDYYKCKRNRCCLRLGHTGPPELPGISGGQEDQMGSVKRAAELMGIGDFGLYVVFAVLILLLVMGKLDMVIYPEIEMMC